MQIQLTKEHEEWLRSQVAVGRFSTLEEAVAEAIDSLKTEDDDLAWAKPLVEEGLAELDQARRYPRKRCSRALKRDYAKSCETWRGFDLLLRPRAICRKSQMTSPPPQASGSRSRLLLACANRSKLSPISRAWVDCAAGSALA